VETVSQQWKESHLQSIVPVSYVEINYNIGDPESQADASVSASTPSFGNVEQIITELKKTYSKYATLEHNHWKLDGTYPLLEDTPSQDTGYISSVLCGEDGIFAIRPVITINFSKVFENVIPGLTITWSEAYDECARDFKVTAYNGEEIVAETTITNNIDNVVVVGLDIQSYDKIEIEIIKWCLPLKRARAEQILIGIEKTFTKTDLIGYTHEQYADILSGDLPKNSIVFEIDNTEEKWNPDNPTAVFKYLIERQELKVKYGYKIGDSIEWIKAGNFYMSEWETPQNGITATFTARDLLEFMSDTFVTTSTSITLYDLALEALAQANLPLNEDGSVKWNLDETLKEVTITIPEEFEYPIADVLKMIANAGRCVIYQDRNGILNIKPIANELTDYIIDRFNSYQNAEYEITKELKSVDVNDGMAIVENAPYGEVQTMSNPLIQDATVAANVATWVKDTLKNRRLVSGDYRADPRLDALDTITVINKFASKKVVVTDVKYTYKGSFNGTYEGRAIDD
jgi:hypothetical protein